MTNSYLCFLKEIKFVHSLHAQVFKAAASWQNGGNSCMFITSLLCLTWKIFLSTLVC